MTVTAIAVEMGTDAQVGHEVSIERDPASAPGHLSEAESHWPGRCRRIVRAALHQWRQSALVDAAEILTSELVTNALRHGTGPAVGMRVYISGPQLVIEVRDGSPHLPVLRQAGPDDEDGRGLVIVDELADDWGTSLDGTRTWCSLALCKGPDPMQPAAAPVSVLRRYPLISLPGDPSAPSRARTITRCGLTAIGWQGDTHAATEVVARLVENAVAHGVMPNFAGEGITVLLSINEARQLVVDVSDPNPKFPNFDEALAGEQGRGRWEAQRLRAEVTWFTPPDLNGKTVRATMTPGPVDL